MVAHSGATIRADRLRPLNVPRPVQVEVDARGWPKAVSGLERGPVRSAHRPSPPTPVLRVEDRWRIDDEWWRQEVSRLYFRVVLANGAVATVFQDLIEGGWYLQTAARPRES